MFVNCFIDFFGCLSLIASASSIKEMNRLVLLDYNPMYFFRCRSHSLPYQKVCQYIASYLYLLELQVNNIRDLLSITIQWFLVIFYACVCWKDAAYTGYAWASVLNVAEQFTPEVLLFLKVLSGKNKTRIL